MSDHAIVNARVVTMAGEPIPLASVRTRRGVIESVEPQERPVRATGAVDAAGRVLMPSFVDCHTHALWAGDRLDEFDLKLRGATYLEILKSGGGIMSTVRAVRAASEGELAANLLERLRVMASEGTLTAEVKSGYGLTTRDELKMLRAIARAAEEARGFGVTVVPTALIAHAIDPEQPGFIDTTITETLDAVHSEFPGVAIDAYCEEGAWSFEDCRRLFERAMELGHPCRVHADQFNALGMTRWAAERGFVSVDHLEATRLEELELLARSDTFGVMLPCSGFQVDDRYANGRALVDAGGTPVIATNCNPGSAPTSSMPFAVALATRKLGLTVSEALAACTVNAAGLLGLDDRGVIAPGKRADLILLRHADERMLAYEFGGNPVEAVFHA
jgi:imidazolonepropionase